jgi:hypothetical protein
MIKIITDAITSHPLTPALIIIAYSLGMIMMLIILEIWGVI